MPYRTDPTRSSGGISLDDAARLYRGSRPGMKTPCPTCGEEMRSVLSEAADQSMHFLHCDHCGRSVVFETGDSQATTGDRSR